MIPIPKKNDGIFPYVTNVVLQFSPGTCARWIADGLQFIVYRFQYFCLAATRGSV
jgi:hypothetical protein